MDNKKLSLSEHITNNKHILYDLFVAIENVITGTSSITMKEGDDLIKYQINPISNQPKILILYEKSLAERSQNKSTSSKLDHETDISDLENVWHLSPNTETRIKPQRRQLPSYENDLAKSCNFNAFEISDELLTINDIHEANKIQGKDDLVVDDSSILLEHYQGNGEFLRLRDEIDVDTKDGNDAIRRKTKEIKTVYTNFSENGAIERQSVNLEKNKDQKGTLVNKTPIKYSSGYSESCEKFNEGLGIELEGIRNEKKYENNTKTHKGNKIIGIHVSRKIYSCNFCNKTFTYKSQKVLHEKIHAGEKSCDKTFALKTTKKAHEMTHTGEKPFKCNYCEKTFALKKRIKSHERKHTGEKPFMCSYCGKTFAHRTNKVVHELRHKGEKPFKCTYCDKTFLQKINKQRHERTHTGEKPFKCSYCDKTFAENRYKQIHERTHTGEKPFKCDYCDKTFAEKRCKQTHERTHKGEKPFKCNYCDKAFAWKMSVKSHEMAHTGEKPFKCNYCDKTFAHKRDKKIHEMIHTGEKPFKCNFCDKTFTQKGQKRNHERKHSGERPYECDYCDKSFTTLHSILEHEIIHTGEKPCL